MLVLPTIYCLESLVRAETAVEEDPALTVSPGSSTRTLSKLLDLYSSSLGGCVILECDSQVFAVRLLSASDVNIGGRAYAPFLEAAAQGL